MNNDAALRDSELGWTAQEKSMVGDYLLSLRY